MLFYWLLFIFIVFGVKLLLATATIYLLLPAGRECSRCEGETLLLRGGRVGRCTSWLLMHRVQRRWCPLCGWEGLARHVHETVPPLAENARDHITSSRHTAD